MKVLYFDCFSGISGDMILGALLDCGVEISYLEKELDKMKVPDFHLEVKKTIKKGITGVKADVVVEKEQHHHRHYQDIKKIIVDSDLKDGVKEKAIAIFDRIAKAEGKIHGVDPEKVHFHEVGAIDSIVDIVGAAICIEALAPDIIYTSPINIGSGTVKCAHGILPVPAPATTEIIADAQLIVYSKDIDGEAATPTGVAVLAELAKSVKNLPNMRFCKQGYGFGTKDFASLNALRVIVGEKDFEDIDHSGNLSKHSH